MADRRVLLRSALAFLAVIVVAAALTGAAMQLTTLTAGTGTTFDAGNSPVVTVGSNTDIDNSNPFPDTETVQLDTANGNVTVTGTDNANVTVDQVAGTETQLSAIDTNGGTITVNPGDKDSVTVAGGATDLNFRDAEINDSNAEFDLTTSGTSTITLRGLDPLEPYRIINASGGIVTAGETNVNGVATVSLDSSGTYRLDASDDPVITSATPSGQVTTRTPTLEVAVDDEDFGTADGDTLDVEIYFAGQEVANDTLTSAGSVSETVDAAKLNNLGQTEWSAVVTDAAGQQVTVNKSISLPGKITIRNETSPDQIINGTTVDVTIIDSDGTTYNRTTTNGEISLDGLPNDGDFVIRMDAPGYFSRSAVIDSAFQVDNIFLLPSSATTSVVEFKLVDNTGNFPQDTSEIIIQKTIKVNGSTEYRTIAGNELEATGSVLVTLQTGEDYRLIVRNEDGDVRILGTYQARGDATEELEVGAISFDVDQDTEYIFSADLVGTGDDRNIKIRYSDQGDLTSEVEIKVYRNGNRSRLVDTVSATTGPYGTVTAKIPVSDSAPDDVTYEVVLTADRDGETIEASESVGSVSDLGNGFGVDEEILEIIGYVALVAVTGLLVILSSPVAAIMATVVAGILTAIGVVPISPVAVALSGAVGVLSYLGRSRL